MVELRVYGLPRDEERTYMESLLWDEITSKQELEMVLSMAKAEGYHSLRVASFNGEKPDFLKTLSI